MKGGFQYDIPEVLLKVKAIRRVPRHAVVAFPIMF